MNDRELLELAAKAAGYETVEYEGEWWLRVRYGITEAIWNGDDYWNPLESDGDALRLAVKLNLIVGVYGSYTSVYLTEASSEEFVCWNSSCNNDPYAATRRAIVRAAAEIGKEQA